MDLLDAGCSRGPAVVAGEIGYDHLQSVVVGAAVAQRLADLGLRVECAHRRSHFPPLVKQRSDHLGPQIAVSACH
jgi:hypothetical protein